MNILQGNALLALAAAALWGGGDFSGGMGVKRAGGSTGSALRVVLLSHALSFTVLLVVAHLRGDAFPHGAALAWGLAAGVAGGVSLTCFYVALSRGAMGAASAVSGLMAAAIPAAVTVWMDGSPGASRLVGFGLAGVAIWLIAAGPAETPVVRGTMALAGCAGAGFGIYFVALKMAGAAGVIWPMATARMGSLSVCSLLLGGMWLEEIRRRGSHPSQAMDGAQGLGQGFAAMGGTVVLWAVSTAVLDTSGNLIFIAATRAGRLDVAAVLASLYPASTILLAAAVLGERPTKRQGLGMGVATAAVVLIGR
jgi:drug/metabolite transporter (DMT)-like permease